MRLQDIATRNEEGYDWARNALQDIDWLLECLDEARDLVWDIRKELPAGSQLVGRIDEWREKVTK